MKSVEHLIPVCKSAIHTPDSCQFSGQGMGSSLDLELK